MVVVVLENHSYSEVIGNRSAPFINSVVSTGALFTQSFAIAHPSQPNYLALFSGSTQGVTDDSCPHTFTTPNLGADLLAAGDSFTGYSEGLPSAGFTGCTNGRYARKHSPWANFSNLPASVNQPFTAFPSDYAKLPTLSFVIPDLDHDMHDGTVGQADQWLRDNLAGYATWSAQHDSLLIVTCDEDDNGPDNQIPTVITGAHVTPGRYSERVDHYRLLRTVEDAYGLPAVGESAARTAITSIWSH